MKISALNSSLNFKRALTSVEKQSYIDLTNQARQELGLNTTSATIFDFSVPTFDKNTGIGTTFSNDAQELAMTLKAMCGINAIQTGPEGEISNYTRSPYSGTSFSLGKHLIDLKKLKEDNYGNLLNDYDFDMPYFNRTTAEESVDYNNIFAPDGQEAVLKLAYSRFREYDSNHPLKLEFENFKRENSYWLEKDAVFEAAALVNQTRDIRKWPKRDQDIYENPKGDENRINELKQVSDEYGNNIVDFEEFAQFIADKEQKEAKKQFNEKGIDIYGDSQIGFSQKDFWAHKSAFSKNYEFGCDIGHNNYSCWSPSIDFNKIPGEAEEFLFHKFDLFFKRYDGARIDAAWQYIVPLVCEPLKNKDGSDVFDGEGNKLGNKLKNQPKVKNNGEYILKNIILKAADKNNIPHNKIHLELLGGNSYDALDAVKNTGTTLIHITRYAGKDWGRVKYYEAKGESKYQNMKPGDYIIGAGTHDDDSLLKQAEHGKDRIKFLADDLRLNPSSLYNRENMAKAITAELFTTKNQFMTLPDILGSERRINTPNTSEDNWDYRASKDYERDYHENLSRGKGLNYPDALAKALEAKNGPRYMIDSLKYYADLLHQNGPMTTKEADRLYLNA